MFKSQNSHRANTYNKRTEHLGFCIGYLCKVKKTVKYLRAGGSIIVSIAGNILPVTKRQVAGARQDFYYLFTFFYLLGNLDCDFGC